MSAFMRLLLCHGQPRTSFWVCGAGAQDMCAIRLFTYLWRLEPSSFLISSAHGACSSAEIRFSSTSVWRRSFLSTSASGETRTIDQVWEEYFSGADIRFSSSSLWRRSFWSTSASGEARTIDQIWEEYFADRLQWWDNRVDKRNPKAPDFEHRVTRKALWIDGLSTPQWAKAVLKLDAQGKLRSHIGYDSNFSQGTAQLKRFLTGNVQIVQAGNGNIHMQSARTTSEVIVVLRNRLQQGIVVDSYMYVEALKRCLKQKNLFATKQVHECIMKSKMDQNLYVANNLLMVYIKCGTLLDARRVFDELVKKDAITWNVMIGGYAQHSHGKHAMKLFNQMRQEGPQPNGITYVSILKACGSPSTLKWGKEVHEYIRHVGLESGVRVGTALVQMYAKCGCMNEARQAFEKVTDHNIISWTTMIGTYAESGDGGEAYRLFLQMKREGFKPNAITYVSILNACSSAGALEWVKEVHRHAREAGLDSDLRVGNALIHMYAKSGSTDDALLVFDRMEERNVISWTAMIGAYARSGCGVESCQLLSQMKQEGFKPDAITFLSVLNASASAGDLQWVKEVHSHVLEAGLESDMRVGSALVRMYAKNGGIDEARLVFDRMKKRDIIAWTAMIGAYAGSGCGEESYRLFLQMKQEGFKPDAITYTSILNASASAGTLERVKEVHRYAREAGLDSDMRLGSALVHLYAKSGRIADARLVFDRMEERDVITWNVMVGGLAQHGFGREALEVFREMKAHGVKPDGSTFVSALSACSHSGLVEEGRSQFLAMMRDYGIEPDVSHCTCMVDLLGRAGHLEEAKLFIGNMPVEPNGATWGALLGACRTHGNVELGELAHRELLMLDPNDSSAYVLLSNIYAAAGKWEEVSLMRTKMQERGIRKEPGRSWIEVDNKIHEFVSGDTSHPEVKEIYAELNRLTEKIKDEGYIPDTRLVLENIEKEAKELALCSHSEKLAIAYGLLRIPFAEPIRVYKNLRVCSDCHTATKFISKVTGRDIVARDANRFHHFTDGVCSCGDYW